MDNNNIYTGIWTNWSRGTIFGPTFTTTKQYGNLIIAFTALFVTFVASRLWRISCLVLHRCFSTAAGRSTIHHQRQVILRNSHTAESALVEILSLFWTWRKSQIERIVGLIPLVIFIACYLAAFTAAGGYSSSISSSVGDEVLINSQYCGMILRNSTVEGSSIRARWDSEQSNSAANYVQQCYRASQSNTTTGCDKFVRSRLPTHTMNFTAECPFQNQICRNPRSTIRLDSGYIDSNDDLGLNAPKDERFAYRYVLHCAPLETNNHTSHVVEDGRGWDKYHYGTQIMGPTDNQTDLRDYLYKIEDLDSQYILHGGANLAGINFRLGFISIYMFQGKPMGLSPIPELVHLDGDVTIAFLSGAGTQFFEPVDDDWYRVTTPEERGPVYTPISTGSQQSWHPNVSASPMGCLEQFQWCNSAYPRDRGCGPLTGTFDSIYGAAPFFNLTNEDLDGDRPLSSDATGARIIWSGLALDNNPTNLPGLIGSLGTKSLASQSKFFSGVQLPIPENQWQLDVLQWWHIILAAIQATRMSWHAREILAGLNQVLFDDSGLEAYEHQLLMLHEAQRTQIFFGIDHHHSTNKSGIFATISCFGLYFTFITGALIIIASYILEPVLKRLHRGLKHKSYAHLEWISNNSLQLHRMAHEQLMEQEWTNCTDDIPTTDPEFSLANLDISNPEHPILRRPEAPKENIQAVEPSPVPPDSSSPTGGSLHSDNAAHLSGRSSMSSTTSVLDESWELNVLTAIRNVSGQLTVEEAEDADADARGDMMDSADIEAQAETAT